MKEDKQQPIHFWRGREIPLWAWLVVVGYMILADNLLPSRYEAWALIAGWLAAGFLCLANFNSCGRYHCKITGPGFLGLGTLTFLEAVGVIHPAAWITWTALTAILAVGIGFEYRYKSKCGTCYVPISSKS